MELRKQHRTKAAVALATLALVASAALNAATILNETFENNFPEDNGWVVGDSNAAGITSTWDDVNNQIGPAAYAGLWKGYCAGTNFGAGPSYQNSQTAYMRRSIDLRGYTSASLSFWYIIPTIEAGGYDKCRVYIDNDLIFERTVAVTSWTQKTQDLSAYLGGSHTLKFEFVSDGSNVGKGWFLDNIIVTGEAGGDVGGTLTNINGANATPSATRVALYTSPVRSISGSNPVIFTGVSPGTYTIEGYQSGTFWGEEFWCRNSVTAVALSSVAATLTRNFPYAESVVIKDATMGSTITAGQNVTAGTALRAEITVRNNYTSALNVKTRILLDQNRSSTNYDFDSGYSSLASVSANGGTRTYSFPFSLSTAGQFYYAIEVQSVIDSSAVRTDSWSWSQTFNIVSPPSMPSSPTPSDGAILSAQPSKLDWADTPGATTYDVYLKLGSGLFNKVGSNLTSSEWQPNQSYAATTFSWYVVAKNANGPTTGPTWTYQVAVPPTASIGSPNGGESWLVGSVHNIDVSASGTFTDWQIDYSNDNGASWNYIVLSPNSGSVFSYGWTIPDDVTSKALVRVRLFYAGGTVEDRSNATFKIVAGNPTARIVASTLAPHAFQAVSFDARNSSAVAGRTITGYEWRVDGESSPSSTSSTAAFGFASTGSHTVQLTVRDSLGKTSSQAVTLTVGAGLGDPNLSSTGGDPVNLATGNFLYDNLDLSYPSPGIDFTFRRYYNSKAFDPSSPTASDSVLGFGWRNSFQLSLTIDANGTRIVTFADGRRESYRPNDTGGFSADEGVWNILADNGDGTCTLTTKGQIRFDFDAQGRLARIRDRHGNTTTVTYDAAGLIDFVTDTVGRVVDFSYRENGRLWKITDPIGRVIEFTQDANGDLVSVKNARGDTSAYTYDALHQMLTATDPNGNVFVKNTYDSEQRVTTIQKDALGATTSIAYDFSTHITTLTDPLGHIWYHHHDDKLRVIKIVDPLGDFEAFEYDALGNRTKVTDKRANSTRYGYDERGNVTSKIDALNHTTTITYNTANDPVTRTEPNGRVTMWEYSASGAMTAMTMPYLEATPTKNRRTFTYNTRGQKLTATDARGNTVTFGYDDKGNIISVTDALGNASSATFDDVGRKLTATDARGNVTSWKYDANDNVIEMTDALGGVTSWTFDANDNNISATDPLNRTTTRAFDAKDRVISETDANGDTTSTEYDAFDRKTKITDGRGGVTTFEYDAAGHLIKVTNPLNKAKSRSVDANGNVTSETDEEGKTSSFVYDALNRRTSTTDPLGNVTRIEFDEMGWISKQVDALGRETTFIYDAMGNLLSTTDPSTGKVEFTYDAENNRISQKDAKGGVTTYVFDALNRVISETDPSGNTWSKTFDAVGNLASATDANGKTTTYMSDALNRRTKQEYGDGTWVSFTYDSAGSLTKMVDRLGTTSYGRDSLGRLTSKTDPFGKTVGYEWDANGNRTAIIYPGGNRVSYGFDAANRLTTVTDWRGKVFTHTYGDANRLAGIAYPNATAVVFTRDNAHRVTGISHAKGTSAPFASYSFVLDTVGNITSSTDVQPASPFLAPSTASYTYFPSDRLATAKGHAVTNDNNGNITVGPVAAASDGLDALTFDDENRLLGSTFDGIGIANAYDGLGRRLASTTTASGQSVTRRYVLDTSGPLAQVIAETDSSGNLLATYVYGVGLLERVAADGTASYYHGDRRGSVIALTNDAGVVTDAYAYDPFGVLANTEGTTANPFRYLGQFGVYENDDGTLFVRARHYSPELGRFVSRDALAGSLTNTQSLNRYVYALNNPVALVDVSGFSAREGTHANSTPATTTDGFHIDLVSLIPIYGSAREAYRNFQSGHYIWGAINTALAISDVFLVKSLVTVAGKVVVETVGKQVVKEIGELAAHSVSKQGTIDAAKGGTYLLRDAEGTVVRTGRTDDLFRRASEHARDPALKDFDFEPVHRTDVYAEQRGLEQLLHDAYQPALNKIRPISPSNPNLQTYLDAAKAYLDNP